MSDYLRMEVGWRWSRSKWDEIGLFLCVQAKNGFGSAGCDLNLTHLNGWDNTNHNN